MTSLQLVKPSGPLTALRPIAVPPSRFLATSSRLRNGAGPTASTTLRSTTKTFNSQVTRIRRKVRCFASQAGQLEPVDLAFDVFKPSADKNTGQSLIICHGLFGSKQNWRSLAKAFAQKLGMPVYTMDLRNHGASPHVEPHSYEAMAMDLAHFMRKEGLTSGVNLLGHSMGGKAVMSVALNDELNGPLRSLISVDMSPAKGKMSAEFAGYTEGMLEVERAKVKTKAEADEILQKYEPELSTRQFLLTNTKTSSGPNPHLTFRIPIELLARNMSNTGSFPYDPPPPVSPSSPQWIGPTLFLKGDRSKYINKYNIPVAQAFFPSMKLEMLDTGHWVHAEKPTGTVNLVSDFIQSI